MPKYKKKTKKSVKKRVRVTKSGLVVATHPGKRHLNSKKKRKTTRNKSRKSVLFPADAKRMLRELGNVRP